MKTPTKEELRIEAMPEFERKMRDAAAIVSSIVGLVAAKAKPGVTLNQLDDYAAQLCKQFKAEPYNLGYKPFFATSPYPAILCLSVNDMIAHGIPNDYALKEGDTLNIDTGIKFNGVCGDCALTIPIGQIDNKTERLLRFANRACYAGIQKIKAGALVVEVAKAVETYAMQMNYVTNVVFCGHDIGEEMHKDLSIPFFTSFDPRYVAAFAGKKFVAGQVVCLEPMLTYKDRRGQLLQDGWGRVTADGKNSAMFEHMVLVKEDGYEILTDHFVKA